MKTLFLKNKRPLFLFILAIVIFLIGLIFLSFMDQKEDGPITQYSTVSASQDLAQQQIVAKKEIVCLDPGHGGNDAGAIVGGIYESRVNFEVADKVKKDLAAMGYQVFLTRDDDTFVYKRDRSRYCNSVNADILVSIHHNSYEDDRSVNYSTVLYYKDSDVKLASSLSRSISDGLDIESKGISKFENSLFEIAEMPSAMTEGFFLTNTSERNSIKKNSDRLDSEAESIVEGIVRYFDHPDEIENVGENTLSIDRTDLED
jgi:N-acetylmuramoyl-L-alanine amidase